MKNHDDIERLAPQKLMANFSKTRILLAVGIALCLHVIIIGGSSLRYIYVKWINPDAAIVDEEKSPDAAPADDAAGTNAVASTTGTNTVAAAASSNEAVAAAAVDPSKIPDSVKETPVIKRITETASPDEIPRKPDDLDLSVEDTSL
jgi:hypothetical protein